ncbi:MAG: sigma-70 family RNA polymerase sigma factor [Thermoanaerobaculia bacterium]
MGGEITQLLDVVREGDREALNRLLPLVYGELRTLAHRQLKGNRGDASLNTTALVHEAYLKLVDQGRADWKDRRHFLAVAATAMRHLVIDHARRRTAQKRGGGTRHTLLDEGRIGIEARAARLLALDEALENLAGLDGRLARLVELRFFGGLTVAESAGVLEVSEPTVKRDWRKAKALLYRTLNEDTAPG